MKSVPGSGENLFGANNVFSKYLGKKEIAKRLKELEKGESEQGAVFKLS